MSTILSLVCQCLLNFTFICSLFLFPFLSSVSAFLDSNHQEQQHQSTTDRQKAPSSHSTSRPVRKPEAEEIA